MPTPSKLVFIVSLKRHSLLSKNEICFPLLKYSFAGLYLYEENGRPTVYLFVIVKRQSYNYHFGKNIFFSNKTETGIQC